MKNKKEKVSLVSGLIIQEKIYFIRGKKVMLDRDLALLYGVETKRLNEAVRRNISRFPEDFMFQINKDEEVNLKLQFKTSNYSRSQFATLKVGRGRNIKYQPFAFTEQGIAMLSSVLNSEKAISVNIQIIRVFTKISELVDVYKDLREKIEEMEKTNNLNFKEIFRVIKLLIQEKRTQKTKIGFDLN